MRTKRKAIAIINRNHAVIRLPQSPQRMEFSEATFEDRATQAQEEEYQRGHRRER
jgi:hypothetical protein